MTAAEAARRQGNFSEERASYRKAEQLAQDDRDQDEASYRKAETYVREGSFVEAAQEFEGFARAHPDSGRAARSWLDAGRAYEKADQKAKAIAAYEVVLKKYAKSGSATSAARAHVRLRVQLGEQESLVWRELVTKNRSHELDEALRYHYAKSLDPRSPRAALLAYEDVARNHPLPHGRYSDEALLRAATLRREAEDAQGALVTLELLLEQGGRAAIVGSYTRTSYVEALLLKGKILRDDLGDLEGAKRAFLLLPEKYPKSRLADDALWEYVLSVVQEKGDGCAALARLKKADPDSRFLRCEYALCGEPGPISPEVGRSCENWLGRHTEPDAD